MRSEGMIKFRYGKATSDHDSKYTCPLKQREFPIMLSGDKPAPEGHNKWWYPWLSAEADEKATKNPRYANDYYYQPCVNEAPVAVFGSRSKVTFQKNLWKLVLQELFTLYVIVHTLALSLNEFFW